MSSEASVQDRSFTSISPLRQDKYRSGRAFGYFVACGDDPEVSFAACGEHRQGVFCDAELFGGALEGLLPLRSVAFRGKGPPFRIGWDVSGLRVQRDLRRNRPNRALQRHFRLLARPVTLKLHARGLLRRLS